MSEVLQKNLALSTNPFLPKHKVAPEWSNIITAGSAVTTRGSSSSTSSSIGSRNSSNSNSSSIGSMKSSSNNNNGAPGTVSADTAGGALPVDVSAASEAAADDFQSFQEGGVSKYAITVQLFGGNGATAAAAKATAEALAVAWQQALLQNLTAAAAARRIQQEPQPQQSPGRVHAHTRTNAAAPAEDTALSTAACAPTLKVRGRRLAVAVCTADLLTTLAWLSAQREVHWLEPSPRLTRRDLLGALVVQRGGGVGDADDAAAIAAAAAQPSSTAAAAAAPFWSVGLDGSSQLLGISDSGVDTDSCYFFDPAMPNVAALLVPDPARRGAKVFRSNAHRKIASYYCYTDFGDADGHGTHVAGIAVGACYGSFNRTATGRLGAVVTTVLPPPPPPSPESPPATAALFRRKRKKPPLPPSQPRASNLSPPRPSVRPPPQPPPPQPAPGSTPPAAAPASPTRLPPSSAPAPRPAPPVSRPKSPPQPLTLDDGLATRDSAAVVQLPQYVIDQATGMAPGARLAMYDIMDSQRSYRLPSYEDILEYQLNAGVFVQSDSWGSKLAFWYNSLCQQLDDVVWRHPELLVLTAAGNDGMLAPRPPNGTVSAPANAKNTLSVGSTLSANPYDTSTATAGMLRMRLWTGSLEPPDSPPIAVAALADDRNGTGGSGLQGRGVEAAAAPPPPSRQLKPVAALPAALSFDLLVDLPPQSDFRTMRDLGSAVLEAVAAAPAVACRRLSNAAAAERMYGSGLPKLVVTMRGNCTYYVKAMAAAAAGAAAVAIVNNGPGVLSLHVNPANISLPAAPLTQTVGQQVLAALAAGGRVFARAEWQPYKPYDDVPSYSAYGPTVDGRIKPDLVAPGVQVLSAWTDGLSKGASDNCTARQRLSGTSMSAPLVAGAAVLARQYFMFGFYPFGRNDTPGAAPFAPSGVLLKAVLIGGAYDMPGMSLLTGQRLEPAPSPYQGFGRADLRGALPLASASPPSSSNPSSWQPRACANPYLQLVDLVPIREGDTHTYDLTTTGAGPVVVTLVWPDPPADPIALIALVNDLDLEVALLGPANQSAAQAERPVALLLRGNSGWSAGRPSSSSLTDSRNNVERVRLPAGHPGALRVRVRGTAINSRYVTRFAVDEQRYALTVHGCFEGVLVSARNPDPRGRPPSTPVSRRRARAQEGPGEEFGT